jgi:hypothetical protein
MLNTLSNTEMNETIQVSDIEKRKPEECRRMRAWLSERIAACKKRPVAEHVTLTPVLAHLLLEINQINRPIGKVNIENLKADIASGRWVFNGESIVISRDGALLDGQHRCQAVVATGVAIEAVLVFGPVDEARYTIDIGKPKSAPNYLSMKGWSDTNNLAAMLSLLLQYRKTNTIPLSYQRPTKTEILQAAETFKGAQTSVDLVRDATKKKLGSRSALAFCHYTFWKKSSREHADEFVRLLIDGEGLRKGNPAHYCRERLIAMGKGARIESRIELIFKCWNAWRRGESINKILLNGSFPKVER